MFHVGQKVVCVRDNAVEHWIHKGGVYTVSGIETDIGGVQLFEVEPHGDDEWLWYFIDNRFRPLVERKTDIGVFTAMLNPGKVDA